MWIVWIRPRVSHRTRVAYFSTTELNSWLLRDTFRLWVAYTHKSQFTIQRYTQGGKPTRFVQSNGEANTFLIWRLSYLTEVNLRWMFGLIYWKRWSRMSWCRDLLLLPFLSLSLDVIYHTTTITLKEEREFKDAQGSNIFCILSHYDSGDKLNVKIQSWERCLTAKQFAVLLFKYLRNYTWRTTGRKEKRGREREKLREAIELRWL